jgi:hypothetical protein
MKLHEDFNELAGLVTEGSRHKSGGSALLAIKKKIADAGHGSAMQNPGPWADGLSFDFTYPVDKEPTPKLLARVEKAVAANGFKRKGKLAWADPEYHLTIKPASDRFESWELIMRPLSKAKG